MGNVVLILSLFAIFAFGYVVADRFGRLMDEAFGYTQDEQGGEEEALFPRRRKSRGGGNGGKLFKRVWARREDRWDY